MVTQSGQLLEADVEVKIEAEDGTITVYTEPTDLHKGWKLSVLTDKSSKTCFEMIPQTEVTLEGEA